MAQLRVATATKRTTSKAAATAPPKAVGPIATAAAAGTTRDLLVALRNRLAAVVDDPATPARDLASTSKRLLEVMGEIEALDAQEHDEGGAHGAASEAWDEAAI